MASAMPAAATTTDTLRADNIDSSPVRSVTETARSALPSLLRVRVTRKFAGWSARGQYYFYTTSQGPRAVCASPASVKDFGGAQRGTMPLTRGRSPPRHRVEIVAVARRDAATETSAGRRLARREIGRASCRER